MFRGHGARPGPSLLIALALANSAVGLMRIQFEALMRAAWLLYAAPEATIVKLLSPLTLDSEKAAKNLPGVNEMLEGLRKSIGGPGEGILRAPTRCSRTSRT